MGLRNPVVLAGVVGVGVPVLAAGVVAALTIKTGESGPDSATTDTTTAPATAAPTTGPALTPTATEAAAPDPVGFQPDSITFISADEGWVLGRTYPCASEPCLALQHTTDGGQTWQQAPLPAPLRDPGSKGHWLKFADARNGWIRAGDKLFATHDGGKTWREIDLDIDPVVDAWSFTISDDSVYIATVQPGERTVLFTSPLTRDAWTGPTEIPVPGSGGPAPSAAVTVLGSRAWMVVTNRGADGARSVDGTWTPWKLPCGGNGPAAWHPFSEKRLVALCGRSGPYSDGGTPTQLMTSTDGGVTFTETGQLSPTLSAAAALIPADPTHLVAALDDQLLTSADGGATWTTTYRAPAPGWRESSGHFVTETTGFVIMTQTASKHLATTMLATQDAGRTWTPVSFGS
ncbi:WD40/YVTN/BNR-like repeat-containing protein [Nocardia sp. NPDC059091]|uniref:WD40/YVTN/BNR-like repeat-containing protein n=1 Tax=unclassified Nocardia TaxID=2637762 RepID=UPI00367EB171